MMPPKQIHNEQADKRKQQADNKTNNRNITFHDQKIWCNIQRNHVKTLLIARWFRIDQDHKRNLLFLARFLIFQE